MRGYMVHNLRGFQSTPPCGGRPLILCIKLNKWCFNPRPRAGGDCSPPWSVTSVFLFQSTPPCGGRLDLLVLDDLGSQFQSTPPCGGRRWHRQTLRLRIGVSIHAPVRGATQVAPIYSSYVESFQSTPPCGGRLFSSTSPSAISCFNPRPRAGGDCRNPIMGG